MVSSKRVVQPVGGSQFQLSKYSINDTNSALALLMRAQSSLTWANQTILGEEGRKFARLDTIRTKTRNAWYEEVYDEDHNQWEVIFAQVKQNVFWLFILSGLFHSLRVERKRILLVSLVFALTLAMIFFWMLIY